MYGIYHSEAEEVENPMFDLVLMHPCNAITGVFRFARWLSEQRNISIQQSHKLMSTKGSIILEGLNQEDMIYYQNMLRDESIYVKEEFVTQEIIRERKIKYLINE